ncbi:hypothetical protein FIU95_11840 [Microbulbifer sp. THAF38]|nr:hypothetical protein FIU95_11840 [Microbulbifer sp. THAF38]
MPPLIMNRKYKILYIHIANKEHDAKQVNFKIINQLDNKE